MTLVRYNDIIRNLFQKISCKNLDIQSIQIQNFLFDMIFQTVLILTY